MSWSAVAFMCIAGLRLALKFNRGGFLAWTIATGPMIWLLGAITTTLPQLVIYGSRTALTPREADSLVMPNIVMWAILAFLLYKIALWFGSTVISDADNAGLNSPESKEKL